MSLLTRSTPFVHGMAVHSSDEEFLDIVAPLCRTGLEAGDSVVVRVAPGRADILKDALDDPAEVDFAERDDQYPNPPAALAAALDLARAHRGASARRLLLVGEPPPLRGLARDAWVRYEAAVNHVMRDHHVLGVCAFERDTLPDDLEAELLRVHDLIVGPGGNIEENAAVRTPFALMAEGREVVRDPLEADSTSVELVDPTPATARNAIVQLAADCGLTAGRADDLAVAVSEVVTNALLHGRPPVLVRAWAGRGRAAVAVSDRGPGPHDPFIGLMHDSHSGRAGGRGLWITHQLCPEVALSRDEVGFTVRVAASNDDAVLG